MWKGTKLLFWMASQVLWELRRSSSWRAAKRPGAEVGCRRRVTLARGFPILSSVCSCQPDKDGRKTQCSYIRTSFRNYGGSILTLRDLHLSYCLADAHRCHE